MQPDRPRKPLPRPSDKRQCARVTPPCSRVRDLAGGFHLAALGTNRSSAQSPAGRLKLPRAVLPCVAGKDQATVCFLHEPQKIEHLLPTDLPGFINDHDCTFRQRSASNELGDRLHIFQPVATESDYLLTLRGGGLGNMSGSTKCILHTDGARNFSPVPAPPRNSVIKSVTQESAETREAGREQVRFRQIAATLRAVSVARCLDDCPFSRRVTVRPRNLVVLRT